ncbi:MAG TPA: hypothetical protein VD947_03345 [Patescibacteria group bacterium]|nr:hypothetical protein [Patescibacteria group bacterium]
MPHRNYIRITKNKSGGFVFTIVILIVVAIIAVAWIIIINNRDDEPVNPNAEPTTTQPVEPTTPNTTGGSTGTGNDTSNDESIETPSPAGGVDTNNITPDSDN